jgi:hypothetical protein
MNNFIDYERPKQSSSIRKGLESIFVVLLGVFLSFLIAGILGAILFFGGFAPLVFPFLSTATSQTTPPFDVETAITTTSTSTPPQFPTLRPSATPFPTFTSFVLPSWTPSAGPPTFTRTPVPTRTRTRTPVPTRTRTRTATPIPVRTLTPSQTLTFTATFTATDTPTPTNTPTALAEPLCGPSVLLSPLTLIQNEIRMDITNNSGAPITITRFFAYWDKTPSSQQLNSLLLNTAEIWNESDPDSPSDVPTEGNWISASLSIQNGATGNFVIQFEESLQPTGYEIHIFFHPLNCQVIGTQ